MKQNNFPGKFIVVEGLDGSGQSTQVKQIEQFLTNKGFTVYVTKEPTVKSEAGRKIREILDMKEKIDPGALQALFVQDRKEHLDKWIIPVLEEGIIVISDRYFFSTFAYGVSDGLNLEELIKMNNNFLIPDMTFLLKVNPKICMNRIQTRGIPQTLFEKEQKLAKVWETYARMSERFPNVYLIDGEKSIEEVFIQIKSYLPLKVNK